MQVDPELAAILPLIPPTDLGDLAGARAWMDQMLAGVEVPTGDDVSLREVTVPASGGGADVRVLVYTPTDPRVPERGRPGILHIHGGGFVLGSPETEKAGAVMMAGLLGAVVVSVDYRLAPEHPFPAGLDDCYAALCWMAADDNGLGIDAGRLAVVGSSAGGGLSAAVALLARDRGGPALRFQFLGIPELDDRLTTPSMRAYTDTPLWNRPSAELSWRYYLGDGVADIPDGGAEAAATAGEPAKGTGAAGRRCPQQD